MLANSSQIATNEKPIFSICVLYLQNGTASSFDTLNGFVTLMLAWRNVSTYVYQNVGVESLNTNLSRNK